MPEDPIPVRISEETQPQRVRFPRPSVMLIATIEQFGRDGPTRHRVRDLAAGGIRIDNAEGMQPGATTLVSIGALVAVEATVKWANDGFAGLAFRERINPEDGRKKAAIPPSIEKQSPKVVSPGAPSAPTAGWVGDLRNPYRK